VKLLIIVLAAKYHILQGYFSIVSNALFQDELSQCDTCTIKLFTVGINYVS
jgi:hypothetical protein